jgi:hypothetical protein
MDAEVVEDVLFDDVVDVVLLEVEVVVIVVVDDGVDVVLLEVEVVVIGAGPRVRTYEIMLVATCSPGLEKSPTAKPISIDEPATRLGNGS